MDTDAHAGRVKTIPQHLKPDRPSKLYLSPAYPKTWSPRFNVDFISTMKPYLPPGQRQAEENTTTDLARINQSESRINLPLALSKNPAPRGSSQGQSKNGSTQVDRYSLMLFVDKTGAGGDPKDSTTT
jgi:hypothetical protein